MMISRLSVFLGAALLSLAGSTTWAEAGGPLPFPAFQAGLSISLPPPGAVSPLYSAPRAPDLGRGLKPAACYAGPVSCDLKSTHMSGHPCTCVGEWGVYWGQTG